MRMGMQLLQIQAMECSFCLQLMDIEKQLSAETLALLFGHTKYSICPNCFQEVDISLQTRKYKVKWVKRVKEVKK